MPQIHSYTYTIHTYIRALQITINLINGNKLTSIKHCIVLPSNVLCCIYKILKKFLFSLRFFLFFVVFVASFVFCFCCCCCCRCKTLLLPLFNYCVFFFSTLLLLETILIKIQQIKQHTSQSWTR